MRSGPEASYRKVDTLYIGEGVEIAECGGNWCHIQHPGPDGWVSCGYLIASEIVEPSPRNGSSDDAIAAAFFGEIIDGVLAGLSSSPAPAPEPELPYGPDTCKMAMFVVMPSRAIMFACVRTGARRLPMKIRLQARGLIRVVHMGKIHASPVLFGVKPMRVMSFVYPHPAACRSDRKSGMVRATGVDCDMSYQIVRSPAQLAGLLTAL